jgi:CRISPR-associated endonuclease/helicase Cas3
MMPIYAHTLKDRPSSEWEPLYVEGCTGEPDQCAHPGHCGHANRVALLAERFASAFGAGDWGRLAGLWHDLGKYSQALQSNPNLSNLTR